MVRRSAQLLVLAILLALAGQAEAQNCCPPVTVNRFYVVPRVVAPVYPVYRPGYYGIPRYYGYPVYPVYGRVGVRRWPIRDGRLPTGGSHYFGNPHASQYFGDPHASQYMGR